MAGPSWLVDSRRIATKIKNASEACDPRRVEWKSNPTIACPMCDHIIDNSGVTQEWPGLRRGVKFDPSDQEILWHLLAKVGADDAKPHPFIDEFIPTVDKEDGICYIHPQKLPGVKQDGSVSHFFHRAIKAYNTGSRKRRKIHDDDLGDLRWHITGKTKPVIVDGIQKGCKKIMVLYMSMVKGGKSEKTNWVMHQYHLGIEDDEKDGEFLISKIFYQKQAKQTDRIEKDLLLEIMNSVIANVDPVTPKSVIPEPPRTEMQYSEIEAGQEPAFNCNPSTQHLERRYVEDGLQSEWANLNDQDHHKVEDHDNCVADNNDNQAGEETKWWEGESQFLLDSQQFMEGLALCDELLQSQSSNGDGDGKEKKSQPRLSDYAHIGMEDLKKDLEECQNLAILDPANIEIGTPPDFRLSQLEFGSQDSFISWGGKVGD